MLVANFKICDCEKNRISFSFFGLEWFLHYIIFDYFLRISHRLYGCITLT